MSNKSPEDTLTPSTHLHLPLDPVIDTCYEYIGKGNNQIIFRKIHPTYKILKSAMKPLGINIDHINVESSLIDIAILYVEHFAKHGITIITNIHTQLLEDRLLKSQVLGDEREVKRIMGLLKMRKALWERQQ